MSRDDATLLDILKACPTRVPAVPWKAIAGMRDKLIHHYDAVDVEEVWKALSTDVPRLLATLAPLAPKPPS